MDAMWRAKILRTRQRLRVIEVFFWSGANNKSVIFDDDKKSNPESVTRIKGVRVGGV